jgi:hypothetical protein
MTKERKNKIMKTSLLIVLVFGCYVLCGCKETARVKPIDKGLIYSKQVNMLNDIAIENAIVTQHTLYPYHFINNSEQLNELGHKDLSILIEHFKEYPGQLNVQQEDIDYSLYKARLAFVSQKLQDAGVDMTKVSIVDGMPGGSGMETDNVIEIQKAKRKSLGTDKLQKSSQVSDRSNN